MERYCPDCKQNVEVIGEIFPTCRNCEYEFSVSVDKAEIVEIVESLEEANRMLGSYVPKTDVTNRMTCRELKELAAKFREKYLEGK